MEVPQTAFKNYEGFGYDPYVEDFIKDIPFKERRKKYGKATQDVINLETGEVRKQELDIYQGKTEQDQYSFIKLFKEDESILDLSNLSLKVLIYLCFKTTPATNAARCTVESIAERFDVSKTSIYTALSDLLARDLIRKSSNTYTFYTNPKFIFNGDRKSYRKKFVELSSKKYKKAIKNPQNPSPEDF